MPDLKLRLAWGVAGAWLALAAAHADIGAGRTNAIVRAAERVGPAVVSVSIVRTQVATHLQGPYYDAWFERFLKERLPTEEVPGLGSGFLVDGGTTVLTNEHVVRGAAKIQVTLADGRQLDAALVGADPAYDVAVLKVEGERLPAVELGEPRSLAVGEWAIAIGNPFGYLLSDARPTVTVGVISALGRDVKSDARGVYKDMIQTDAAINPGNSGGPLVDADGRVVGVNTFIFSRSGGSIGMGFAIPIDTVMRVASELQTYGRVRDIWIGLSVGALTPAVAKPFGLEGREGLVVTELDDGSPAALAGLEVGDLILKVNDQPVTTPRQAQRVIFGARPGDRLLMSYERQGVVREAAIEVVLAPVPEGSR